MPAVYEIKFLPSGDVLEFYGSRGDSYECEDGSCVGVISKLVWCRRCGDFTHSESIEGLDEIDQLLADLHDPSSEVSRGLRYRLRIIEQMEERRRWLLGRRSPPKCLECGSTDIVIFRSGERAEYPGGPGWVEITVTGHCSTSFNNRCYTPEGDRIPTETKPTYWTLRG
jgi:hypothetical protein